MGITKSTSTKLKRTQVRQILEDLKTSYDCDVSHLENKYFYLSNSGKVHISNQDLEKIKIQNLNSIGLYFGKFMDSTRFKLSLEGTGLIKPNKNYVKFSKEETLKSYLAAENLFVDEVDEINQSNAPFLIVIYKDKNLGCVSKREKELLTYLPKSRKLDFNKVF